MPALMPAVPGPETSPNPKGQALGRGAESTQRRRGEGKFIDLMKSHGTSILCAGIFQQFRTGSEPVSGDQCCRWVFKQPTCKWSLAKTPRLTAFLCVCVRNAIFRCSRRNTALCLLRAGVQMSTASSGECQVLESCHWVCKRLTPSQSFCRKQVLFLAEVSNELLL